MMAVTLEKLEEGKKIFEVNRLAGLRVHVESKRKPTSQAQCYRCHAFGNVQYRCTAFCVGNHASRGCERPRGIGSAASCVNCGGDHPAFYISCPKHPMNVQRVQMEKKIRRVQEDKTQQGFSYVERARGGARPSPITNPEAGRTSAESSAGAPTPSAQGRLWLINQK